MWFEVLRKVAGLVPAILLLGLGWTARGYYDGYYEGKAANKAAVRVVNDFKKIQEVYGPIYQKVSPSDEDSGRAVSAAIDGLRVKHAAD